MKKLAKTLGLTVYFIFMYFFIFSTLVFKIHMPADSNITYDIDAMRTESEHEMFAYLVEERHFAQNIRLALIEAAEQSIDVSYYTIHNGISRDYFYGALLEAADRGVEVRLILDGTLHQQVGPAKAPFDAIAIHPNITIKLYDPMSFLTPHAVHNVLHDKFLIIDEQYGLTGGRNIGDRYYEDFEDLTQMTYDRDVLIFHPTDTAQAVIDMKTYYNELFNHEFSVLYEGANTPQTQETALSIKDAFNSHKAAHDYEILLNNVHSEAVQVENVTFMRSPLTRMQKDPIIMRHLSLLAQDYDTIFLQSPYIIFSRPMLDLMPDLTGKEVKILTNNMHYSPNIMASSGYIRYRSMLAEHTALYEYQSPMSLHTKTLLLGDDISVIGSVNLDPRSAFLSTESVFVIYSEAFNKLVKETTQQYLDQSLRVDTDGNYYENSSVTVVEQRPIRIGITRVISFFTFFFDEML